MLNPFAKKGGEKVKKRKERVLLIFALIGFMFLGFVLGVNLGGQFDLPSLAGINQAAKETVSARELMRNLKNKNFTLINVHTPYEGEIEKTDSFIAYDQLVANSGSLPKDKNTPIILYCQTGRMSSEAIETLKKMGYTNVRHLSGGMAAWKNAGGKLLDLSKLEAEVLPGSGAELPVSWGDIGPKLIALGVVDLAKFKQAVALTAEQEEILTKGSSKKIKIDRANVQFVVDWLWAAGLAQKSIVYDQGPMGKEYKGQAGSFASTGGWTLASGNAMNYYNGFDLIPLTAEQQNAVAEIAKNVYRPCCGNSTYFPDCNHGMAALAMIELMVSAGVDQNTIYRKVLDFNAFWFPDTYLTTATYFARQGTSWKDVDAKRVMGSEFSSGQGAAEIAKKVGALPWRTKSGSSCGA